MKKEKKSSKSPRTPNSKRNTFSALMSSYVAENQTEWSVRTIDTLLLLSFSVEKWKGYITLQENGIKIQNRNKTFHYNFKYNQVCGILEYPSKGRKLIIGVFDRNMTYFTMEFKFNEEVEQISARLSSIKGPDKYEKARMLEENGIDNPEEIIDEVVNNEENAQLPSISRHSTPPTESLHEMQEIQHPDNDRRSPEVPIAQKRSKPSSPKIVPVLVSVPSASPSPEVARPTKSPIFSFKPYETASTLKSAVSQNSVEFHTTDVMSDSDSEYDAQPGQWIEEIKFISYEPNKGGNIESEFGSTYMYVAHQVAPNNYYDSDSDSDSY